MTPIKMFDSIPSIFFADSVGVGVDVGRLNFPKEDDVKVDENVGDDISIEDMAVWVDFCIFFVSWIPSSVFWATGGNAETTLLNSAFV